MIAKGEASQRRATRNPGVRTATGTISASIKLSPVSRSDARTQSQRSAICLHNERIPLLPRVAALLSPETGRIMAGTYDMVSETMALLFYSPVDSAPRWQSELARLAVGLEIRVWPDIGDPDDIDYALVWRPPPGLLASLPKLRLILSLGAGVDHILRDPQLPPGVPIVRLVDPYLMHAMSEYVALQVLKLHRQDLDYRAQQQAEIWHELPQKNAAERPVGILGFGEIGKEAGRRLKALGFPVSGWSRSESQLAGFSIYAGSRGLARLLGETEILVCLLPLTQETAGILCTRTFAALPRGAALINAGRGGHLVEEDLISALDSGQLSAAALDVFREEPLPPRHPFWRHPRIVVTPHIAGVTNAATAAPIVLDNIHRVEAGQPPLNRVDPNRGY
jgi:glyoxylate/hydroxypyruvate reductase